MPTGQILMSKDNPEGWKLEDLFHTLRDEIWAKQQRIKDDERPVAQRVYQNNNTILSLLSGCEKLQLDSVATLAAVAPDQGPTGTPRIGVGSETM